MSDRLRSRHVVGARKAWQQEAMTQPEGLGFKGRTPVLGTGILGKKQRQEHSTGGHNRDQGGGFKNKNKERDIIKIRHKVTRPSIRKA